MVSLTGCLHCSFNHCNNNNNNNNNNSPPCAHDYREEEKITTTSSDNNEEQQQQQQQQVLLTMQITNLSTDDEAQRIVVQRQETVALSSLVSEKPFSFCLDSDTTTNDDDSIQVQPHCLYSFSATVHRLHSNELVYTTDSIHPVWSNGVYHVDIHLVGRQ